MSKKQRTVITPAIHIDLSGGEVVGDVLRFEKQILPLQEIEYTAKDGTRKKINFDEKYLKNLELAFAQKALDQVPFALADADNKHTMDPERVRGQLTAVRLRTDVEKPGLYGTIEFSNPEQAKAITNNLSLGVSARIREHVFTSSGEHFPAALIHVLGTTDPQVAGMAPWTPLDLSRYDDNVLDLSQTERPEMPKTKTNGTVVEKELQDFTDEEIDAMTDEEIDAMAKKFGIDLDALVGTKPDEEVEVEEEPELEPALAGKAEDDVELANEANFQRTRANDYAKKFGEARWKDERNSYMEAGVPAYLLDLAAPVMSRPEDTVIDLSNEDAEDVNVSDIVRGLLDATKGMVDLAAEAGHEYPFNEDTDSTDDPDGPVLAAWSAQFGN